MSKNKKGNGKFQPADTQERLNNEVNTALAENQDQNHNTKKQSLGPNTKR